MKGIGLITLVTIGLVSCTKPTTESPVNPAAPQATAPNAAAPNAGVPNAGVPNSTQTISLDDAAEQIDEAFDQNVTLREFDLDADDEQNAIVLEGQVRDAAQRTLAEDMARQIAPSASVVNQITVQ